MLAEDAVQEIFMKILVNMNKFSAKSKFSTWVYSVTYNYCIDIIRRNKRAKKVISNTDISGMDREEEDEIDDKYLLEIEISRLKVVLDELDSGDKAVLLMKYQDDMSISDMADIYGKTDSAIKMRIKRAKERFKRIYEDMFNSRANE